MEGSNSSVSDEYLQADCPQCQTANPAAHNFCRRCGALLRQECPRCQMVVQAEDDFCGGCGLALTPRAQFGWGSSSQGEPLYRPVAVRRPVPAPVQASPPTPALVPDPGPLPATPSPPPILAPASNPVDRFLPKELAVKLDAARASGAMVGERRVVTMLFCDVKGSTAAAEQLDPEEWTEIINGAFEQMIGPVYQYEGTVARLMGDAILAFFGAPIAHEDDPQRAVLAGLEIIAGFVRYQEETFARYGLRISARVGINTGLVVVGAVGSDLRMEYTAMGDAINLAARMEQTAKPGTVQIADATYRLVKPLFDYEELGGIEVKGKSEPVLAYRVIGRKAVDTNMRGIEGMRAPLIGRDREIAALHQVLDRSQQRLGHIVCLTGEAGLGKSRLIEDAHAYWGAQGYAGNWQVVSSLSYETSHAYGLFRRMLRRLNQVGVTDSPTVLRQKLLPMMDYFPEERRARAMQAFESMFGLASESGMAALEGETFKQELYAVLLHIWKRRFADEPTVLVFDDIHWSDPASVDLLIHLLAATESMPLVLICAFRPDVGGASQLLQSAASQSYAHRYTEIKLSPLSDDEIDAVVDGLLTIADLPASLRQTILERANGIPFFVEEVVRGLIQSGVVVAEEQRVDGEPQRVWRASASAASVTIPDNLQGLLAARIDRLEEDIRGTLQLASVIGRSFYARVLAQLATRAEEGNSPANGLAINQHLRRLLQLQMIQEATRIPEVEYIFRNPMTQEVVYNGILLKRRREFHHWVGLGMESLYADQMAEMAPRLAYHFAQAREHRKAFDYLLMAGNQATRLYAHREALTHYDQALSLLSSAQAATEQVIQLYSNRGRVLEHMGSYDEALKSYETLGRQGREEGNRAMQLQALVLCGTIRSNQNPLSDFAQAEQLAQEALALAQEMDDKAAEATIHWNLMMMASFRRQPGDDQLAIRHGEHSLALARSLDMRSQMALTLNNLSVAYFMQGQYEQAAAATNEARALFRDLGDLPMLADSYAQSSYVLINSGDFATAEEAARELSHISAAIGNLWNQGVAAVALGTIELERGHLGAALDVFSRAAALEGMAQVQFSYLALEIKLAEIFIVAGSLDTALIHLQRAQPIVENMPSLWLSWTKALRARIRLLQGDTSLVLALTEPGPTGDETMYDILFLSPIWQLQAEVALTQGKVQLAVDLTTRTVALVDQKNVMLYSPVHRLLLAKALWLQGDEAEARQVLAQAEADARRIGSRRTLWPNLALQAEWESDVQAAQALGELARAEIDYIADNAGTSELRQSFLSRPDVAQLLSSLRSTQATVEEA